MMQKMKEEGRMRKGVFARNDGVMVEFCLIDNGRQSTAAFINGWGTTSYSEWYRQMGIKGYNLLFFNNRGNGKSGLGGGDYMSGCASDLRALLSHLGIGEVNLVGHSMGGLISTIFFNDFSDSVRVRTMTFVSSVDGDPLRTFPYRFLLPKGAGMDALLNSYQGGILGSAAGFAARSGVLEKAAFLATMGGGVRMSEKHFASLYRNFLSRREADVAALRSMMALGPEVGQWMRDIDVPALIIHAKGDFFVSPRSAMEIHERVKGSELHMFNLSTHAPMIEQPRMFNEVFVDFLDRHNSGGADAA